MKNYYYDDAVEYLEDRGYCCDPGYTVGEFTCDLLDDMANEDDRYPEETLILIMKMVDERLEEDPWMKDELE